MRSYAPCSLSFHTFSPQSIYTLQSSIPLPANPFLPRIHRPHHPFHISPNRNHKTMHHSPSMAFSSSPMKSSIILSFAFFLLLRGTFAEVICEALPTHVCSLAIASSGKRCVLENYKNDAGKLEYTCKTSEVVVERMAGYIESDQCVKACGVDRKFVGISSDAFLVPQFTQSLCSPACYNNCPNIVDLYFNLAAGEGAYLPRLCEKQKTEPHRAMMELLSSGIVAAMGPIANAPATSPAASGPAADAPASLPAVSGPAANAPAASPAASGPAIDASASSPAASGPVADEDELSD